MKKFSGFLTALALIVLSFPAFAQTAPPTPDGGGAAPAQGSVFRGFAEASIGYGMCNGDDCDHLDGSLGIHLAGFYQVMPNIFVGGNFTYQMLSPEGDASFSSMAFSAEGRYYHPINPKVKVYGLGGLGFATATIEVDMGAFGTAEADDDAIFVKLGGGADYMIAPNMSVGAQLYYQLNFWSEEDNDGDSASVNYIYLGLKFGYYF